jgi:hypothetical protein
MHLLTTLRRLLGIKRTPKEPRPNTPLLAQINRPAVLCALATCLALSAAPSDAADYMLMPLASYHTDRDAHYNETNIGIGYARDISDDVSAFAVRYPNSLHKTTLGAGATWQPLRLWQLKAGALAMLATGYPTPVVIAPLITYQGERYGADITFAPSIGKGTTAFVGLQLRMRIN